MGKDTYMLFSKEINQWLNTVRPLGPFPLENKKKGANNAPFLNNLTN